VTPDRVGVVVVTWNAADLVRPCLTSVPADIDVVVVDNASTDDTIRVATEARPDVQVIARDSNDGFAVAANVGVRELATKDAVLLLNPDCRLAAGAIGQLVDALARHPRAGLVSARVRGPGGEPERHAGGRDPSLVSVAIHYLGLTRFLGRWSLYRPVSGDRDERRDWVAGTAVLARRAAVDDVGLLDESYFLYAEDHDWCRRMRERGWEVWVTPAAEAEHLRAASVSAAGPAVRRHRITSLDAYYARGHGPLATAVFRIVRVVGYGARAVAFTVAGRAMGRSGLRSRGATYVEDTRIAAALLRSHA